MGVKRQLLRDSMYDPKKDEVIGLIDTGKGVELLTTEHSKTKSIRQRGSATPNQLATAVYLRSLENELETVRHQLAKAWAGIDSPRDFLKCMVHMDQAQQRLHRVIRRLGKQEKKK